MKELRHLKNYNDFVNEGLIGDAFKGLFKGIFGRMSKAVADKVNAFNDKLKNAASLKDALPLITTFAGEQSTTFDNMVKDTTEGTRGEKLSNVDKMKDIKGHVKDQLSVIQLQLNTLSQKFNNPDLKPNKFYEKSNNKLVKDTFNFTDEKTFEKNLDVNTLNICKSMGKTAGLDDTKLDVLKQPFDYNDVIKKGGSKSATPDQKTDTTQNTTTTGTEQKTDTTQQPGTTTETPKTESVDNKIFEADAAPAVDISDDDLKKFGTELSKFIKEGLYGGLTKHLTDVSSKGGGATAIKDEDLKKITQNVNITTNKDNLNKILQKILSDKNSLLKVRDALGLTKEDTPL